MTTARLLIVEDNASYAFALESQLKDMGYDVCTAHSAEEALTLLDIDEFQLIISDLLLPAMDGQELFHALRKKRNETPFIILTAHGSAETAIKAIKSGAFDYLKKDCSTDEIAVVIKRALEFGRLTKENARFKEHLLCKYSFQAISTFSPAMRQALMSAEKVAASPRTIVSIYGESGVGKEVLARAIHFAGGGMPSSFVAVNCAAMPETLIESELFGHVKGAFTGAEREREGKFALAAGGTLLLDEIGDMPLPLQVKLLRVIENRTYEKIGSNKQLTAGFRIISSTHRDLKELVRQGKFREDLFHRLNVFPIFIPPLRERKKDIPMLVEHYWSLFRQHQGKPLPGISHRGMDALIEYPWPGNVRELRNHLERAAILVDDELIRPEHLGFDDNPKTSPGKGVELHLHFDTDEFSLDAVVKKVLEETLQRCEGNKSLAAERLKINRKMFNRKKLPTEG